MRPQVGGCRWLQAHGCRWKSAPGPTPRYAAFARAHASIVLRAVRATPGEDAGGVFSAPAPAAVVA